ncbi:MAG: hypothetical protein KBS97_02500 [Firmicutes bacterium]|nr:hypothetical protein [Candidatus Fiminaster equi]
MKKSKLIATAMLASTLVLAGCDNGKKECNHVDEKAPWHICDLCGEKCSEHSFGEWSQKSPADFEHKKVEHRVCSICGEEETREVGEVVPHHYSDVWSHDDNKHWHACTDEGYENLKKDEAAHSFGEWSQKSPADFEHKEVQHRFCSACDYEETKEVGEVVPHHYSDEWSHDENKHWHACTDEDYEDLKKDEAAHFDENNDHKCDDCEYLMSEHKFSEDWSNDETNHWHDCEFEGCDEVSGLAEHTDDNKDHKCDDCEYLMSEHKFSEDWSFDATNHWHDCEFEGCDEVEDFEAHIFNSWTVKTAPTYEASGVEARQCKICGHEETRDIPQLTHTFSKTLFQGEDTHYYKCLDAGFDSLKKDEEAHSFGEWKVTKEATFEEAGLKERVCSACGKVETETISKLEHKFSEVYSADEYSHWHACTDEGYETLTTPKQSHVDIDGNDICDDCEKPLNPGEVTGVSLSSTRRIIGKQETIIVKANITKTGFCDGTLVWTLLDKSGNPISGNQDTWAKLTVIDNETAMYECISTSTNTNDFANRFVKVELASDDLVTDQVKIISRIAPDSRTSVLKSFMTSVDFDLPYNWAFRPTTASGFYTEGNKCDASTKTSYSGTPDGTNKEVISAYDEYLLGFRNLSQYTESVGTEYDDEVIFTKSGTNYDFEFHLYTDGEWTYIVCYKFDKPVKPIPEYNEFPMDIAMKNVAGQIACDIIAPTDVDIYQVPEGSTTITAFGDASNYIAQLDEAGYVKKVQSSKTTALSPDGTLQVVINDKGSYYTMDFSAMSIPSGTDWTAKDKEMMSTYLGEVLPYVNYNFGAWYDYYDYGGYIYTSSSRVGAQEAAKAVFDAEPSFEASVDGSTFVYTKSFSKYVNMVVQLISGGQIHAFVENARLSTWEASDIAAAVGSDAKEEVPVFQEEGAKFAYEFGENTATVFVYTESSAVSMLDYKDVLALAGFTSNDDTTFKSPTDTLTITVTKVANKQFKIVANGHLPEGQYRELPVGLIAKQLNNDAGLADLALPEGDLFFYEANDRYQCDVTVLEGGSMSNYINALEEKGFALKDDAYEKEGNNISVVLSAGEGDVYSAHLSLIEEPPQKEWSQDELNFISENMSYNDFTSTTIPCPSTSSSTSASYSSWTITVNDGNIDEFAGQLENAGFTVAYDSYWERYKISEGSSCYMYLTPSTGTTFVISWQY